MTEYFRAIDALMRKQPMPIEFSGWKSTIICNDCAMRSTVWYHFEYHKCPQPGCGSYNTNVAHVERGPPRTAAEIAESRANLSSGESSSSSGLDIHHLDHHTNDDDAEENHHDHDAGDHAHLEAAQQDDDDDDATD